MMQVLLLELFKWCLVDSSVWCNGQNLRSNGKIELEWQGYNGNTGKILKWEDWGLNVCIIVVMRQFKSMCKGSRSRHNCPLFFGLPGYFGYIGKV
ncbi:hypothetical protein HanIR_Chr17g0853991 [Helianthus annuus]|nr:hypothetical protein HanIR_Chr17g0853991 [Helianthus annuus]